MEKFVAEEKHILPTLQNFGRFCDYIDQERPKLSQRLEVLGKNDLFRLNSQLLLQKNVSFPYYMQESYPYIDLMFKLALSGGLYRKVGDDKTNIYLEKTSRKKEYDGLNSFEKYYFLFEIFWTKIDYFREKVLRYDIFDQLAYLFSKSRPEQELVKGSFPGLSGYDLLFFHYSVIVQYFNFFGVCTIELASIGEKKAASHVDSISKIIPGEFGVDLCKILCNLKLRFWNHSLYETTGVYTKDKFFSLTKVPFLEHLKPVFPENSLYKSVRSDISRIQKGNFTFKVMLSKSIWRKIKLSHKHTLEDLHLSIQEAFNFDNDHLYSFFMDGKKYSQNAYHSPYGDEGPYVDDAIIGKLGLYIGRKIYYLFDWGYSWEFLIQLVDIDENDKKMKEPQIIETRGEAPPQYPNEEEYEEDFEDDGEENENSDETPDNSDNEQING